VLAGELAAAQGAHQKAFAAYEALLREYIGTKQRAAPRFAGIFAPKTRAGLYVRNQIIRALAIPGLARWTAGPGHHRYLAASRLQLAVARSRCDRVNTFRKRS